MKEINNAENMQEKPATVSYVVYRDAVADNRWLVRKLVHALIIVVVLLFASNAIWLWVWQSYEFVTEDVHLDSDGTGIANYTGGNGGINFGEGYNPQNGENQE